jgi:hypothetical protein
MNRQRHDIAALVKNTLRAVAMVYVDIDDLFSAADAFVTARLGRPSPASAAATLRPGPFGPAVEWRVEIRP